MTDRPIIFSAPMVQALLAGRKTQTRRLASSPLRNVQPGDRLWVRESIWQASRYPGTLPSGEPEPASWCWGDLVHYAADGDPPNCANRHYGKDGLRGGAFAAPDPYAVWLKRPSIHMPRWASRLTLIVTATKIERLQAIGIVDARAEGCEIRQMTVFGADQPERDAIGRRAFEQIWESLHGPESWAANPEVVAISFRVERRKVDARENAA